MRRLFPYSTISKKLLPQKLFLFLFSSLLFIPFFLFVPSLPGLARQAFPQASPIRDALGNLFLPGAPPQRIISLAPNLTEILFALGLGNRVVGVTRFCNYPPEAACLPQMGGILDPSLEKIRSLRPDLILAFRGTPLPVLEKIKSLQLPLFVLDEGQRVEDLFVMLKTIGAVTKSERQAEELVSQLQSRLAFIEAKTRSLSLRPRVFLTLSGAGHWTCGSGSFLHDLIEKAGGQNIATFRSERWVSLTLEELVETSPEVIVILAPSRQSFVASRQRLLKEPALEKTPAVIQHRFGWLEEDPASRFGPRLLQALEALARIIHPELFSFSQKESFP